MHHYLIKSSGRIDMVERCYNSMSDAFLAMQAKMGEEDKLNRGTSWWVISTPRTLNPGMVLGAEN